MEVNHELAFSSDKILQKVRQLPEASEEALDELRRDPIGSYDLFRISEVTQKHGRKTGALFKFFGEVISSTEIFLSIDFDDREANFAASDGSQEQVVDDLFSNYRGNYRPDDISPERIIAYSNRANLLRAVARLAILEKIEAKPLAELPAANDEQAVLATIHELALPA